MVSLLKISTSPKNKRITFFKKKHLAGIYIHIPFCKQACNYCNFHFSTSLQLKDELIAAMIKEIDLGTKKANQSTEKEFCDTIYFGGGTPSLLSITDLKNILDALYSKFEIKKEAEITLEANPDDIKMIIGKKGRTIKAIRELLKIRAIKEKKKFSFNLNQ